MVRNDSVSFREEMSAANDWQCSNRARIAKTTGNSKVKRKRIRPSKDEAMEKEETDSYSQDVVESSQQHVIYKRNRQLGKQNPNEPVEVLPDVRQSRLESREESNGDDIVVERVRKKAKKKEIVKCSTGDIVENENTNYLRYMELNDKNLKKAAKAKRKNTSNISSMDVLSPVKKLRVSECRTLDESLESDKLLEEVDSLQVSNSELEVLEEEKKPEKIQKYKKKEPNTLLSMIDGSSNSSESDDEHRKIAACSVKSRRKSDTRKRSGSNVERTIISDEEEEQQPAGTTLLRNPFSSLKQGKSLNDNRDDRLKGRKSNENCSKDERKSLKLQETIKTETLSTNADSSSESASISVKDSASKSERSRQNSKRKNNHIVGKKRSNTLLSMIHDGSSSSESDNEDEKIADRSTKSLDNGSLRKRSDATVREAILTGDKEKEHQSSDAEPLRNFSSLSKRGKTLNDNGDDRLKSRKSEKNCSKDKRKSLELQETIKTETLLKDTDSSSESLNISVKDSALKSEQSRQDSKRKKNHTVRKKRSNTLLSMIHDGSCSSESDNENKKIAARRIKSLDRLKGRKSKENSSKVKRKSHELQETINTEILSTDTDSSSEAIKVVAPKSERWRKNSKSEENHTVKKQRSNILLSMILDCSNSSESDEENKKIVDSSVKSMDNAHLRRKSEGEVGPVTFTSDDEEERQSSDTEHDNNSFSSLKQRKTLNNDLDHRLKDRKSEKDSTNNDGKNLELEETIKTENSSTDRDSSSESASISLKDSTSRSALLRQDSKPKKNTLLSMIHDSSESDDESKKIADRSGESRISQTVRTSDEEEEHQTSNTKAVGKFVSPSKSRKTLNDYWKNKTENVEVRTIVKSENVSMDEDSRCDSRDVSVKDSISKSGALTENRKHKVQQKVEKKKSNTLLTMIDDNSSNSDCQKEKIKIEDDSDDSVNTSYLRKRIKSRVSVADMSSDDESGNQSSETKPVNRLSKSRNFDLNVEAEDLEHLISVLEDEDEVPRDTLRVSKPEL